jgi:hypothetical protein
VKTSEGPTFLEGIPVADADVDRNVETRMTKSEMEIMILETTVGDKRFKFR